MRALEVLIFSRMTGVGWVLAGKQTRTILTAIRSAVN
jgi:hypothetical protein